MSKVEENKGIGNSVMDDDEWVPFEPIFHKLVENQKIKGSDCKDRHYTIINSFAELKNLP
jgi:hypothetical protein